jgi:O-acetyl-ADP-ribose deacetylase (regulator of RNase III)
MIEYTTGNLLEANVDAVVNTVNEVGVMGKGIALMFREEYPDNARLYEVACKAGSVRVGHMFVTNNPGLEGPRWIINFPTKKHWRHPSKLAWIRDGLSDLVRIIDKFKIRSIAIPPLGCGAGGLEWLQVRKEIESALQAIPDVEAVVYAPTNVYQNARKRSGVEELTPARALIAELVRRYAILGIQGTNLEVQKLAWFLQRMTIRAGLLDPLDLRFKANRYGPYADRLRHLLNGLDGSYLICEKRLSDAGPLEPIAFNDDKAGVVREFIEKQLEPPYRKALEATSALIDGFESPLGMELLATVDWLIAEGECKMSLASIKDGLANWPGGQAAGRRKLKIFSDRLIEIALRRLQSFRATAG